MTLSFPPVEERSNVTREILRAEIVPAYRPVVLRGFAADWPAVRAGRESGAAVAAYLKSFDNGAPVEAYVGPPEIGGRFFYSDAERAVNFERRQGALSAILDDILALGDHISSLEDKAIPAVPVLPAIPVPHLAWPTPLAQAA